MIRRHLDRFRKLRFLRRVGAQRVGHSDEDLLSHLKGVSFLLAQWKARRELCDAGLFHSVYGTEFFDAEVVDASQRERVRSLVGDEAETLAWLWHRIHRASIADNVGRQHGFDVELRDGTRAAVTPQQLSDLVTLWIADALEQLPRRSRQFADRQPQWLEPLLPFASPAAAAAARKAFNEVQS